MPQQHIPRIFIVFLMVIISLLLPNSFWKRRGANGIWKAFQKWVMRSGFKLNKRQPSFNNPDAPTATGTINLTKIEIIIVPKHRNNSIFTTHEYHTVLRVHSSVKSDLEFSISLSTLTESLAKQVGLSDFKTGNESFDRLFDVESNDDELMAVVIDDLVAENLIANQFLFQFKELEFRHNYLRYERNSAPVNENEIQDYYTIAEFMSGIVAKIDEVNRRKN